MINRMMKCKKCNIDTPKSRVFKLTWWTVDEFKVKCKVTGEVCEGCYMNLTAGNEMPLHQKL